MDNIIRTVVALLFAGLLIWQSRAYAALPNRRRAYQLAAAAIALVGVLNAALAAGLQSQVLQLAVGGLAMLLLLGAAVSFLSGYRGGEMRADAQRAADMAREYRERREREIDESRKPKDT